VAGAPWALGEHQFVILSERLLRAKDLGEPRVASRFWRRKNRAFGSLTSNCRSYKGATSMEFQDKVLTCIDCATEFVFTAGEQLFFHDKQFKNEPKRCKSCKSKRVAVLSAPPTPGNGHHYTRVETRATCSQCGKETTVPFRPTQGRPIFCRECFIQKKTVASA
jgi:CxxC-x17-CxxC domain-containing protein